MADELLERFGSLVNGPTGELFDRVKIKSLIAQKKMSLAGNISAGQFVIFKLSNQPDFFVTLFSCWELGLIPVIVPPRSSDLEVTNIHKHFNAQAILSDGKNEFVSSKSGTSLNIPDDIRESTALVLLTSGTLSEPKAIFLSFRALKEKFAALEAATPIDERQNALCFLPLCFGHGLICNSLFPLLTGSQLTLFPAFELAMVPAYLKAISQHEIHFFSTVPVILKVLLKHPLGKHSLRRVHCASAPLMTEDWQTANRWLGNGASLIHVYGLTEFSGWVAGSEKTDEPRPGLVGKPWGTEFKVDTTGEVLIRGAGQMSGFVENGQFHIVNRNQWHASGDSGELQDGGNLVLTGRKKDVINYGGFKVHPEDLDALLIQHPAVEQVCCFALNSENLGEVPAAAIVTKANVTEKELKSWCLERIHAHKVPVRWFFVEQLPVSERGKVSRRNVREYCESKYIG